MYNIFNLQQPSWQIQDGADQSFQEAFQFPQDLLFW